VSSVPARSAAATATPRPLIIRRSAARDRQRQQAHAPGPGYTVPARAREIAADVEPEQIGRREQRRRECRQRGGARRHVDPAQRREHRQREQRDREDVRQTQQEQRVGAGDALHGGDGQVREVLIVLEDRKAEDPVADPSDRARCRRRPTLRPRGARARCGETWSFSGSARLVTSCASATRFTTTAPSGNASQQLAASAGRFRRDHPGRRPARKRSRGSTGRWPTRVKACLRC